MDTELAWLLGLYGIPTGIGILTGLLVFRVLRMRGRARDAEMRREACVWFSGGISGVLGFATAIPIVRWLDSIPRGTSDTGTALALFAMPVMNAIHSAVVGAIAGFWAGRGLRRSSPPTDN